MAGLKDIAEQLDVSPSLVSKVLNNRLGTTVVREELAERIRRTAAAVGYQKNRSAAALTKGRHAAFGVLIHRIGTAGSGLIENLLEGISGEANRRHHTLTLDFFQTNEQFYDLAGKARRGGVDGLLIAGFAHQGLVEDLLSWTRKGMPVVTIHDQPLHESIVNVSSDQKKVGYAAAQHLVERGCRRIAELKVTDDRHAGYATALEEAGLPYDPTLVQETRNEETPFDRQGAMHALGRLLESGVPFDGLFTHCDEHAMDAERLLLAAGRHIPEDVKLASIDNAPYCDLGVVPISSVSQNYRRRGQVGVELLLNLIEGRAAQSQNVDPQMIPRESTGSRNSLSID